MKESLQIGLSAQMAIEKRMETLADNVANVNTVGFRATRMRFEEALSKTETGENSFVKEGGTFVDTRNGALTETGNSFDFAIRGDGWFGIQSDQGLVLTRDGRFTVSNDGELQTLNGHPVVDAGGAPIRIDGAAGPVEAGQDGVLYQNGRIAGSLGLFSYDPTGEVGRAEGSAIIPASAPEPIVDRNDAGVVQGFIEESNVDPIREMTQLISLQRRFESVNSLMTRTTDKTDDAVKFLGGR
ncbi:flagellar basal-body rod protein FlgF [Notoacmeibacter sp. MSK16QG-6]|uniref:flagellar basal-body rod protein FlgF n=1 Tax=Notoacmeibacter sp. MSK16QG-6 TaxID=2957982 RepID=UPI0020A10E0E|nr:flagellar basal-body rod protein FlgF [Notoacmeibacter sp. MSK16QG-6]MCP1200910.1 flagellar basal-body rod protein FlgF [Notoacmeibacter sp. MSK16QG-6]